MFSLFRGLASPIWFCTLLNPFPSSLISLLDRLYWVNHVVYYLSSSLEYGDPCLLFCTYILGHTLGMQAFTFLLCVLALCMMYVYIYLFTPSSVIVTVHVICGEAMPNFRCESKVTCRWIFTMKIQYFAQMPQESINWDHTHSKAKPQNPHECKAPKSNAKIIFFTANLRKLRYQNKGLSLDRCCEVPNTFPTRNQTSGLKNQDFFAIHIKLGKMPFFLAQDWYKINQKQVTNHTLEKPNDWWQLHLPLVIPLNFVQDLCHTPKGRPTFLHQERERERERESTRSSTRTTKNHREGLPMASRTVGGQRKA